MLGDYNHGFLGNAKPLGFHGTCHHLEGLARADTMRQQGIPAVKGMGDSIFLMFPKLDFRVHAGEGQAAAVILAGTDVIEMAVIVGHQPVAPFLILENPLGKFLLEEIAIYSTPREITGLTELQIPCG